MLNLGAKKRLQAETEAQLGPVAVPVSAEPGLHHVVLMHGFLGFTRLGPLRYFSGVAEALADSGFTAHSPRVNPLQRSDYRAYQWFFGVPPTAKRVENSDRLYGGPVRPTRVHAGGRAPIAEIFLATGKPVLLIAHSQGCRDARFMLSPNGLGDWRPFDSPAFSAALRKLRIRDCVKSLATVAGAHNGMGYCEDLQTDNRIMKLMCKRGFNRFVSWLSKEPSLGAPALFEHGRSQMLAFNRTHPDPHGVDLFSVAGWTDRDACTFFLKAFHDAVHTDPRFEREENDGLVSLSSAMWPLTDEASLERLGASARSGVGDCCLGGGRQNGAWNFLGTVRADHVDQIGLPFAYPLNHAFDHLKFYVGLARRLAGECGAELRLQVDGSWAEARDTEGGLSGERMDSAVRWPAARAPAA